MIPSPFVATKVIEDHIRLSASERRRIWSVTLTVSLLPNRARVIVDGHTVYDGPDLPTARRIKAAWSDLAERHARVQWKIPPDWDSR